MEVHLVWIQHLCFERYNLGHKTPLKNNELAGHVDIICIILHLCLTCLTLIANVHRSVCTDCHSRDRKSVALLLSAQWRLFVSAQCHPRPEMAGGSVVFLFGDCVCLCMCACSRALALARGRWAHISYSNQCCPVGAIGERFYRWMFLHRLIHLAVWIDGTQRWPTGYSIHCVSFYTLLHTGTHSNNMASHSLHTHTQVQYI